MSNIEALKAKHAKELLAAEFEEFVIDAMPAEIKGDDVKVWVHSGVLYGSVATICFETSKYHGPDLDTGFLVAVVKAFPAVATTMVRDSCLSFRPTAHVDALPEKAKERWQEESAVSPMRLNIEPMTNVRLEAEWFASLADGRIVRIEVRLGYPPRALLSYNAQRVEFKGGHRFEKSKITLADGMQTIHTADGEPVAQTETPIRWSSGGSEYPEKRTVYFVDLGADADPATVNLAIAEHVDRLVKAGTK